MNEIIAIVEYDNNISVPSVGIQGIGAGDVGIRDLADVDDTNLENGSVLVYKTATSKWTSTRLLEQQIMEGGEF